jgi:NDP-sugar pyrophosphorylase family protein
MKAVILAAGKGSRMKDLTNQVPKPMLVVGGRPLLERKIENLPDEIDEVIIIVGHLKEKIISHFGDSFAGKKITYVESEPLGTGYALWQARKLLVGEFLSMMGDDVYSKESILAVMKHPWAMSTYQAPGFPTAGDITTHPDGYFKSADFDYEGKKDMVRVDIGLYKLQNDIFNTELVQLSNGEYGLPHTIFKHIANNDIKMYVHDAKQWFKMNSPSDLEMVNEYYKSPQT